MNRIPDPLISGIEMEQHFNTMQGAISVGAMVEGDVEEDTMLLLVNPGEMQGIMMQNLNLYDRGSAEEQKMQEKAKETPSTSINWGGGQSTVSILVKEGGSGKGKQLKVQFVEQGPGVEVDTNEDAKLDEELEKRRMELEELVKAKKVAMKKLQQEKANQTRKLTRQLAKTRKLLDDEVEKAKRRKIEGPKMRDYVSNMLGQMEDPPYVFLSKKLADISMPLPSEFAAIRKKMAENPRPGCSSAAGGVTPSNVGEGASFLTAKMSVTGPQAVFFDYEGNNISDTD